MTEEQSMERTLVSTDDMIATMLRLQSAKDALEQEEQLGKRVIEQVRANVEADLAPRRQEIEDCRRSIEAFIRQTGVKFKAPGLGTAYIAKKRRTSVADEEAFREWADQSLSPEMVEEIYPAIFQRGVANKYVSRFLDENGELLPGVESEESRDAYGAACREVAGSG